MVAINNLQNTQHPSKFLSFWLFQGNFPARAHFKTEESPSRRQTRGHTERPLAICCQIGTAQSKQKAALLALLHSFTPLSSCAFVAQALRRHAVITHESTRTMRLKDLFLPGEIDPQTQTKAPNYPK